MWLYKKLRSPYSIEESGWSSLMFRPLSSRWTYHRDCDVWLEWRQPTVTFPAVNALLRTLLICSAFNYISIAVCVSNFLESEIDRWVKYCNQLFCMYVCLFVYLSGTEIWYWRQQCWGKSIAVINNRLRYCRGTTRCTVLVEILSAAKQLYETHLERTAVDEWPWRLLKSSEFPLFHGPYMTSY